MVILNFILNKLDGDMTLRDIIKDIPTEALDYDIVIGSFYNENVEIEPSSVLTNKHNKTLIIEYD